MSSRFLRGNAVSSPTADRPEQDRGTNDASKRFPSNPDERLSSVGSSFTPEDSAMLVRNVAEVAAAAATLAVHNSQSPNLTPQATPRATPSFTGPSPKYNPPIPDARHATEWEQTNADLPEVGMGGGHDAPNWGRTKSSVILLVSTILYAVIAGMDLLHKRLTRRNSGRYS